ncbi:MAG: histidine kinase dimerization/phospho-acceptor domain-containing protein, partial [Bacteroidota bacterium]
MKSKLIQNRINYLVLLLLFVVQPIFAFQYGKINVERIDSLFDQLEDSLRFNPRLALRNAEETLFLSKRIDYTKGEVKSLLKIATANIYLGEKEQALVYADSALVMARSDNFKNLEAEILHAIGLAYQLMGQYDLSLINYHDALNINESLNREEEAIKQYNNIALVRRELKDYEIAMNFLQDLEQLAIKLDDTRYLAMSKINKGYVLLDQGKFKEAEKYVKGVFDIYTIDNDDLLGAAIAHNIYAQVLTGLEKYKDASYHAKLGIAKASKVGYKDEVFNGHYTLTNVYYKKKEYFSAIEFGKLAVAKLDSSINTHYTDQLYNILSESYLKAGLVEEAYRYRKLYEKTRDNIYNSEKQKLIMRLNYDYKTREREIENAQLKKSAELDQKLIYNQRNLNFALGGITLLILLLSASLYRSLKLRNRNSAELEKAIDERTRELKSANEGLMNSNKELERFAFIASHDLKEPLLNIMSFSSLLNKEVKAKGDTEKIREFSGIIQQGAQRMYKLVEGILEFSKIGDETALKFKPIDLNKLLSNVHESIDQLIQNKKVDLSMETLPTIQGNSALLFSVFKNLIENAIKFNQSEVPKIEISSSEDDTFYQLQIKDNGIGIPENFKESIFEMFN